MCSLISVFIKDNYFEILVRQFIDFYFSASVTRGLLVSFFFFWYHVFLNLFLFLYICTDVYTFKDMVTSSNLYRLTSERQDIYQLASSGIMEGPAGDICKREGPAPGVHGEQTCY